jgi:ribosome assembly protein YihI (activator of Der GTPase)
MDKQSDHICTQQQNQTAQELSQTPVQKRIEDLALKKIDSLNNIAVAIEKNGQGISDALFYIGEALMQLSRSLQSFTDRTEERIEKACKNLGIQRDEAEQILTRIDTALSGLSLTRVEGKSNDG